MAFEWDPTFLDETIRELRDDATAKVTIRIVRPNDAFTLTQALRARGASAAELTRVSTCISKVTP